MNRKYTLGIVGVRGYVGRELLNLLADQKHIQVEWVSSRQLEGSPLSHLLDSDENFETDGFSSEHYYRQINIESLSADLVAERQTDIIVLALPNGLAASFVDAIEMAGNSQLIIDLSADYRFNDDWVYSVPELLNTEKLSNNESDELVKISNPGCYATAMQIALAPLVEHIQGRANCFGISGYSGAGTTPSANNDPKNLKSNILPYALLEHLHEREVSYQLDMPISFSPHVAEFFRGISMTVQLELSKSWTVDTMLQHFKSFYVNDAGIKVTESIPNIQQTINTNDCIVGGFKLSEDGKRLSFVSCLDNLLKGAASQSLQNINLVLNVWKSNRGKIV